MAKDIIIHIVKSLYEKNLEIGEEYLRGEVLAALGFSVECDDGRELLEYYKAALGREKPECDILTVVKEGCRECAFKKAPCEIVCPVGAIKKNEEGYAQINFDACISCGKCVGSCDYGAIHEKSQVVDILNKVYSGKDLIALLAPSIVGQFPCSVGQIKSALKKIGFKDVFEVAYGADITAKNEALEFRERLEKQSFLTTSCCNAYMELVRKHIPEMKAFVSNSKSPGHYIGEIARRKYPNCENVFMAPCTTKRKEGILDPYLDNVLNFKELEGMFTALGVDVGSCEQEDFELQSSKEGRNFPSTGSVAKAVSAALKCSECEVVPVLINGLNRVSIENLKEYAKSGECHLGNLIEIMACPGGCLGGNANLNSAKDAKEKIEKYAQESFSLGE